MIAILFKTLKSMLYISFKKSSTDIDDFSIKIFEKDLFQFSNNSFFYLYRNFYLKCINISFFI